MSSDGNKGEPATTKAAEQISESVFEHELSEDQKKAASPAVHYAMGAISGAVYGAAREVIPLADAGGGALFGVVLWILADEGAVPALHLSKPPSESPARTHLNALAAHIVYGVSTHLLSRELLTIRQASREAIRKAAILGFISGLRSMSGPWFLSMVSNRESGGFRGTGLNLVRSPGANRALAVLAAGELIADKLPKTPSRIRPIPLAFRALAGGVCGAAIFSSENSEPATGALLGAASALAGAFGGYSVRQAIDRRGIPDFISALGEDTLVVAAGRAIS